MILSFLSCNNQVLCGFLETTVSRALDRLGEDKDLREKWGLVWQSRDVAFPSCCTTVLLHLLCRYVMLSVVAYIRSFWCRVVVLYSLLNGGLAFQVLSGYSIYKIYFYVSLSIIVIDFPMAPNSKTSHI